jgi:hypothetical protein
MLFAWARRAAPGALLFAFAFASACSTTASDSGTAAPSAPSPNSSDGASAGAAITFEFDTTKKCNGSDGLCVAPLVDVRIVVSAPDASVGVALEGDYVDASLDADELALTAGHGIVTLHAASKTTTFRLVARMTSDPTRSAELLIMVSSGGFATLRASPAYAGHRPAPELLATAVVGTSCASLAKSPPSDQAPWTGAPRTIPIALPVDAGAPLSVYVRIGHYAFGCSDVAPLATNDTRDVIVDVIDSPMALDQTDLDVRFAYDADTATTAGWSAVLDGAIQRVSGAFFPSSTPASEGTALLDGVRATIASPDDQAQFDALRSQYGWDAKAASWLTSMKPSMHDRAAAWLAATKKDALGPLVVHLASGTSPQTAAVTGSAFGDLSASSAALVPPSAFGWTADPDDTVHLSGAVELASTPLVAHLADLHAAKNVSQATDCPSAIAIGIDGPGLAASLVGSSVSYGACAAPCTADAIRTAIAAAWVKAGAAATAGADVVHFALTASGPAGVGDHAEPTQFSGRWVGQTSGQGVPATFGVQGDVTAALTGTLH